MERRPIDVLAIAAQVGAVVLIAWTLWAPDEQTARAALWKLTGDGARRLAYPLNRLAVKADAAYHRTVAPYG